MNAAPSTPNTSGDPSTGTAAADAPFLGTPYIIDMQRPYEYPFPSPATESCPSLLLPYSHSHPSTGAGHAQQHPNAPYPQPLQLTHPFPPSYTSTSSSGSTSTASSITSSTPPSASSTFVHRTHNIDIHAVPNGGHSSYSHYNHHRDGCANPYPSTSGVHPPISFRPTTLLRRRSSSHESHHNLNGLSPVSSLSVPIPPRLLGRDLPLGGGVGNANGRWRKGRRSGSDGDGSSSVK